MNRRKFIRTGSLGATAMAIKPVISHASDLSIVSLPLKSAAEQPFWPGNARLAVSISLQFEAGGQPITGASGLIPDPIKKGYPDLASNSYFDYGVQEGIPRLLDLLDKHGIKATSFMVGAAVDKNPQLAHEIVRRGHEAAAHGKQWNWQ